MLDSFTYKYVAHPSPSDLAENKKKSETGQQQLQPCDVEEC